jgi:hypothetical protein
VALLALGCAGPRATGFEHTPHIEPTSGLVWIVDGAGRHRTLWVSIEDGRSLSSLPIEGPLWADGPRLWQWRDEPVDVRRAACGDEGSTEVSARRVILRELVREREVELGGPTALDVLHEAEPLASVGPLLFVRERGERAPCEQEATRDVAWHFPSARTVEVLREDEHAALRAEAARDGAALVGLTPRWDAGHLALDLELTAGASASPTRKEASWLPERLRAHDRVPRWVGAAMARAPEATLAGWSRVEHAAPAGLLDTLRR